VPISGFFPVDGDASSFYQLVGCTPGTVAQFAEVFIDSGVFFGRHGKNQMNKMWQYRKVIEIEKGL